MSVFAISDLHLSINNPSKAMDAFGNRWNDYQTKIYNNWNKIVGESDTVIIPGDISWGSSLQGSIDDLRFLDSLSGKKIISKGNHDFWWSTVSKLNAFFEEENLTTLTILNNNALLAEDYIITGTRGWFSDPSSQNTVQPTDFNKIVNREAIRLRLALTEAARLRDIHGKEIIAFFHFPPLWKDFCDENTFDTLNEFGVKKCYFGHIHGCYNIPDKQEYRGVELTMISADYLNFIPKLI
ncbi:MAG: metallophosphoesterase [Clostridia bacterium]|nr:metallophosphoesterase [Clostridia bacterium]